MLHSEPIYKYMTVCPYTIGRDQTLEHAKTLMRDNTIRHLPVLDGGGLVGVLSERDVDMIGTQTEMKAVKVEEAMTAEPYIVAPDAKLSKVASDMANHKYGCAIVVERGLVAGVFTTVDALRVLARVLEQPAPEEPRRHRAN